MFMKSSLVSVSTARLARAVAAIAVAFLCQIVLAQRSHREAADKGPRAVGLLEFAGNGKAHLIPITIMVDGKFYDASAYKASPVPITLESGTVYEAVRSGVSQGLFTVTGALQGKNWLGTGNWKSAPEIQADAAKKKAREAAKPEKRKDDQDRPPVLRRAGSTNKADSDKPTTGTPTPEKGTPPIAPAPKSSSNPPATASSKDDSSSNDDDPDRPQLRRGRAPAEKEVKTVTQPAAKNSHVAMIGPSPEAQIIPAISDASGPDPHSYVFETKPEEEAKFRTKMLAMAAGEVNARSQQLNPESLPSPSRRPRATKGTQPTFDNVHILAFDLSTSNEPVFILTANAHLPVSKSNPASSDYFITLVAREDIYAELHKAFSAVTDNQHLDVSPRVDPIDAVDIDGDARGELLFRQVYDRGSAYVVYRVIGNQLWPLYQSAISSN
jgi:hypothetical protein